MTALTNAAETALLTLMFQNGNWANVGDATGLRGSATAGSYYISLHTADPGETGTQSASETAYTGYARIAVARSGAGFTVSGNNVSNAAEVLFGTCTAAPGAICTHFGIGTDVSGAGNLLLRGTLTANYQPAVLNAPRFPIGDIDVNAD